jgi:uncharacterized protein (DUF1684 family)
MSGPRWEMTVLAGVAAAVAIYSIACGRTPTDSPAVSMADEAYTASVNEWRAQHEASYREGYVTIAGLHALKEGANTAGSARTNDVVLPASVPATIGRFVLTGDKVRYEPAPNTPVAIAGQPVTSPLDLHDDATAEPDELVIGDVRMVVHPSGDTRSIRVRDPNGAEAKGFLGFTWFPIETKYRVTGRFIADAQPRKAKVVNTYGHVDEYTTEGVVEFTLDGQPLRLRPFTTRPKRFYFVFRDASGGHETYEAARFLYADLADDGTTVLDFNQAYNPPCAFNPFTTCPIPLAENRLAVKILAGEKAYPVKVPLPGAAR